MPPDKVSLYLNELFGVKRNKTASQIKKAARKHWSECIADAKKRNMTSKQMNVSCYGYWFKSLLKLASMCNKDSEPKICKEIVKRETDMVKLSVGGAIEKASGGKSGYYIKKK